MVESLKFDFIAKKIQAKPENNSKNVQNNATSNPVIETKNEQNIFDLSETKNEFIDLNTIKDVDKYEKHNCSAAPTPFIKFPYHDDGTKDGVIGNTKQRGTGDCWLLSGINALSYTEAGREAIKNALEYHNGYTTVHTAAGDYNVYDEELAQVRSYANILSRQYSTGDDDMLILELATEKLIDDYIVGNIALPNSISSSNYGFISRMGDENGLTRTDKSSIRGTFSGALYYMLTGKEFECYSNSDSINQKLDEYQNNTNGDLVITAASSFKGEKEGDTERSDGYLLRKFTDLNTGEETELINTHGYSVKSVDNDTVTIVNPWDTSKEIRISREDFVENFYIQSLDLSENNSTQNFMLTQQNSNEEVNGNRYDIQFLKDENGNLINKTYKSQDGSYGIRYIYDKEGNISETIVGTYNKEGRFIEDSGISEEEGENIFKRGLLNNPRFSYEDIKASRIASLTDEEWEGIQQYLCVPGLKTQMSAMELRELSKLSDEDKKFAVDFMIKYPDVNKSAAMFYSDTSYSDYITTNDLEKYANGENSIIEQFIPDNLKDSWYDGFDVFNLHSSLRDCLKKIEETCGYKDGNKLYQRIITRHLIANPYIQRELSGEDIYYLSMVRDENWDKAMEYLKSNPNLSGEDICYMFSY